MYLIYQGTIFIFPKFRNFSFSVSAIPCWLHISKHKTLIWRYRDDTSIDDTHLTRDEKTELIITLSIALVGTRWTSGTCHSASLGFSLHYSWNRWKFLVRKCVSCISRLAELVSRMKTAKPMLFNVMSYNRAAEFTVISNKTSSPVAHKARSACQDYGS